MLGKADSPVLHAFENEPQADIHTENPESPGRFELAIADADDLRPAQLEGRDTIEDFLATERWLLVLDVGPRDHAALQSHTGFDVTASGGDDRSEAYLFRIVSVDDSPTIEIVDSGPLSPPRPDGLSDRRREAVKRAEARSFAELIDERVGDTGPAQRAPERKPCPPLQPAPDPDVQHVAWCYTETGSAGVPDGYWTRGRKTWWMDSYDAPGAQTTNWTFNHRFDVFLQNDPAHPEGTFQTITYDLNGRFNPAQGESFFRMGDQFSSGWVNRRNLERAWWTGRIGVEVKPNAATDKRLTWQFSAPEAANTETSYSSGQEFSIGFNAGGSVGAEGPGVSGGINASASFSSSKTYAIKDWGVQNLGFGNDLKWIFSSRHPCDARTSNSNINDCFDYKPVCCIGPYEPALPNELSRGQMQVNASGRWRTGELLTATTGNLGFDLRTPVTVVDTYCQIVDFGFGWCGPGKAALRAHDVNAQTQAVAINADWVNPIDVSALTLNPATANGATRQVVTGTVTLEKATPVPVNVRLFSNSGNAVLGAPLPNVSGGSQSSVTIPKDSKTATFKIQTNDNQLQPGGHTTATITAFYAEATSTSLVVTRP